MTPQRRQLQIERVAQMGRTAPCSYDEALLDIRLPNLYTEEPSSMASGATLAGGANVTPAAAKKKSSGSRKRKADVDAAVAAAQVRAAGVWQTARYAPHYCSPTPPSEATAGRPWIAITFSSTSSSIRASFASQPTTSRAPPPQQTATERQTALRSLQTNYDMRSIFFIARSALRLRSASRCRPARPRCCSSSKSFMK